MEGVLGDVVLVNGAPWPVAEVDAARYRLRILNASNARRYRLALSPGGELTRIGSDGGLLAAPVRHTALDVAPAERFDVVVDFAAYPVGSEVTLVNSLGTGAGPWHVSRCDSRPRGRHLRGSGAVGRHDRGGLVGGILWSWWCRGGCL